MEEAGVLLGKVVVQDRIKVSKRFLTITKDALKGNKPLRNGQEYYFAVVPYAFNPAPLLPFHALQSAVIIKVAVPQTTFLVCSHGSTKEILSWFLIRIQQVESDGSLSVLSLSRLKTTGDVIKSHSMLIGRYTTWSLTRYFKWVLLMFQG